MEIITDPASMQKLSKSLLSAGETIGLVPTMGYLHEGHISLIKKARKDCSMVIVSIFINPIQFGPGEDYGTYPRDTQRDRSMAEKAGADYIFKPSVKDMYPDKFSTFVEVVGLDSIMCGAMRPGHFRGVCTVVIKLFNIIYPDRAYFGLKDYQQYLIIKKMVKDLELPVKVIGCPIVREKDGLAMSSRNKHLSASERKSASILYKNLLLAKEKINNGENNLIKLKKICEENIKASADVLKVDYFDFRESETLEEIGTLKPEAGKKQIKKLLIAGAVRVGKTRLIDNLILNISNF
ncbi:MAG: Pantothenate synthetase [Actinobacteria bacterium ADurb.Bin346]|nr:MAG: Pantothenate synthetase [Actinobacteria bacterium ADurb.Bin346]